MNVALRRWTKEQFLDWVETQEERFEFDGFQPVGMTGGLANHNRITLNIHAALRSRLRGTPCSYFGPDLAVETTDSTIRYPDALVTCSKVPGTDRIAPDVCTVFEVISPTSGQVDRIAKVREYAAVPTIRSYVIVESRSAGLTVLQREDGGAPWTATTCTIEEDLNLPEIGLAIPVAEIYEDVDFPD